MFMNVTNSSDKKYLNLSQLSISMKETENIILSAPQEKKKIQCH